MDITIKNLDPATESALSRSNDLNNSATGQTLTVEEFAQLEALDQFKARHVAKWKAVDAEAITSKLAAVADKLTPEDLAAIDAIVESKAEAVEEQPIESQPVIP